MKEIRYAVIGVGRMGGVHAKNLAKGRVKNAKLLAVCDLDAEKLKKFPKIKGYTDYNEMFKEVKPDAVIVATPHYFHVDIAVAALKNGINVLSEKPVAVTVGEAERARRAVAEFGSLRYGIMYNQRTNAMYRKAKELMRSGALGEIKRADVVITGWYRAQCYYNEGGWRASWNGEGGGILLNQCVHQIDILQWLLGMPAAISAEAFTKNRNITVENEVFARFYYPNGMICSFTASGHELWGTDRWEIAGDKGKIVITATSMKYTRFNKSESEVNRDAKKGYGFTWRKVKRYSYGICNAINDITVGQQLNVVKAFTKALLGKGETVAGADEGINALSLINGIYLSSYKKEKVNLPLNAEEVDSMYEVLKKGEK